MEQVEHTENLTVRLTRWDLDVAIRSYLALPTTWTIDDLDVEHDGQNLSALVMLSRPVPPQ